MAQTGSQNRATHTQMRKRMKIFTGLAAFSLALLVFRETWLLAIGDFLIVEDTLHPADVIHVIAGDDYRTDYAIQLYKQGYAKKLFFTGGWCKKHQYDHGVHAEERSLAAGVPSSTIVFDDAAVTSTYMEAERLREWIFQSPYPVRSVMVVSDPFHMRRVQWTYRRVLGESIEIKLASVPFDQTPYQRPWWKDWKSRKYVRDEYQKYVYYILRYQLSSGKFQKWLVSLDTE
jgi:uncharacterized SAM-binding protein YcdF (DUF218 family)